MPILDWSQCTAVESVPGKVSGAWVFRGTRLPVATVIESCVGCGLCGEVSHAATLCPSFYRTEIVFHPSGWERFMRGLRGFLIGLIAPKRGAAA